MVSLYVRNSGGVNIILTTRNSRDKAELWIYHGQDLFNMAMILTGSANQEADENKRGIWYISALGKCRQAVENSLKAVIILNAGAEPPKMRDLNTLASLAGLLSRMSAEQIDLLSDLTPYEEYEMGIGDLDTLKAAGDKDVYDAYFPMIEELLSWISGLVTAG